jgi:hypothetical protein
MTDERAALIRQVLQQFESRELLLAKEADTRNAAIPPSPVWGGSGWAWPYESLSLLPPG